MITSLLCGFQGVSVAELASASLLGLCNTDFRGMMVSVLEEVWTKKPLFLPDIMKCFYFCEVHKYLFWKQNCSVRTIPLHALFQDYWAVFRNIQICLIPIICTCYISYAELSHCFFHKAPKGLTFYLRISSGCIYVAEHGIACHQKGSTQPLI